MVLLGASTGASANTIYLWVYIAVGVPTLLGFALNALRGLRNQGRAEAKREERERELRDTLRELKRDLERHERDQRDQHARMWDAINRRPSRDST